MSPTDVDAGDGYSDDCDDACRQATSEVCRGGGVRPWRNSDTGSRRW